MAYKTINVSEDTYDRLRFYKHAGMTFDRVLQDLMELIPEEEFYRHVLTEHRIRKKEIENGDFIDADDLEEALSDI